MAQGFTNKILRVDLDNRTTSIEQLEDNFCRKYLGGAGFVSYYLLKELKPNIDPLSKDNILVFANGPLTGAPIPGASRNCIGAKSPLSGGIAKSEVGGFWGYELKRAGFDGVIVKGKASKPVYIWINNGEVTIRDASHLWGKTAIETQDAIEAELGERFVRSALIGPAGEKEALVSCIMVDLHDAAGRGGLGAVMGSKNLKGICIKGRTVPKGVEQEKLLELSKWMNNSYMNVGGKSFHDWGTGDNPLMIGGNKIGNLPVRNWGDGDFPTVEKITAETLVSTGLRVGMEACPACQVKCKKVVELQSKRFNINKRAGGPEYETIAGFGSFCGIDDLEAISKANEICNFYGMDTISASVTIAFAMECFENEILTLEDTGGIDLRFGNTNAMLKVVEMMGKREGVGDLLADGTRAAAKKIGKGAKEFAMHVKGVEMGMHEPRLKQGLGISYAINPHGGDHMTVAHDTGYAQEGPGIQKLRSLGVTDPLKLNDLSAAKVNAVKQTHIQRLFNDAAVMCHFVPWTLNQEVDLIRYMTGWDFTTVEAMRVGERVATLSRVFNMREGLTAADDNLPKRFFKPTPRGALKETAIDQKAFGKAVHTFYDMMGWDSKTGVPTSEKLEELGVAWAEKELAGVRA